MSPGVSFGRGREEWRASRVALAFGPLCHIIDLTKRLGSDLILPRITPPECQNSVKAVPVLLKTLPSAVSVQLCSSFCFPPLPLPLPLPACLSPNKDQEWMLFFGLPLPKLSRYVLCCGRLWRLDQLRLRVWEKLVFHAPVWGWDRPVLRLCVDVCW